MKFEDSGRRRLGDLGDDAGLGAGLEARVLKASALWWGVVFTGLSVLVLTVDKLSDWVSDVRSYALTCATGLIWSVLATRILVLARQRIRKEALGKGAYLVGIGAAVAGVVNTLVLYASPTASYAVVPILLSLETSFAFNVLICAGWYFSYLRISSAHNSLQIAENLTRLRRQALAEQNVSIRSQIQPDLTRAALARLHAAVVSFDKGEAQSILLEMAQRLRSALDGARALPVADVSGPICETAPKRLADSILTFHSANCAAWTVIFAIFVLIKTPAFLYVKGVEGTIKNMTIYLAFCVAGFLSGGLCRFVWARSRRARDFASAKWRLGLLLFLVSYFSAIAPAEVTALLRGKWMLDPERLLFFGFYYIWAYASLLCMYYYAQSLRREVEQRVLLAEAEEAAAAARNSALRYQVRPHFLFNTLNALYALIMDTRWEQARAMCDALTAYVDKSFAEDGRDFVPVAEQTDALGAYLSIEAIRFGERLRFHTEIPGDLAQAKAPALILHPLVENAMKYAVATSADPVDVAIEARREGDDLVLAVRDSGGDPDAPPNPGLGIGLSNVRARLAGHYGGRGLLDCKPLAPKGFVAEIRLPLEFAWAPSAA